MDKIIRISFLLIVGLYFQGCTTTPKVQKEITPLVISGTQINQESENHRTENKVEPTIEKKPEALINLPAANIDWVSWEDWCVNYSVFKIRKLFWNGVPACETVSPNGNLMFVAGNKTAYWNGVAFALGIAPRWNGTKPLIHRLDLEKSLVPLISGYNGKIFSDTPIIVIDPGHGGRNIGAQSIYDGTYEKELTLDWAKRIESILTKMGWTVILTRTNDIDLELSERISLAERVNADVFISLHFNSTHPDKRAAGIETYCITPAGMSSTFNRNYEEDINQIYPNNSYDQKNFIVAMSLQSSLCSRTSAIDRGVKRARFLSVLRPQQRPAVLIEGGFLSNPNEAKRISSPWYRQLLAEAVVDALVQLKK